MSNEVRRGWSDWEYGMVMENDHMTARELGEQLGRTEGAVWDMRRKLRKGWAPAKDATEEWGEAEEAVLLANKFMPSPELAKRMGRTTEAIKKRRAALKERGHDLPHWTGNGSPFRPGQRPMLAKTCPDCGFLLQARWFQVVSGAWRRRCTRCHDVHSRTRRPSRDKADQARRTKESSEKYQKLTLPFAENNGQPYTEQDMKILSDPDLTLFQKAIKLKRSYLAAAGAAHRYGFPSAAGLGDPERDQWIIDNPQSAAFLEALAMELAA